VKYMAVTIQGYKDPLHPGKNHYRFFPDPWLESGEEHRLQAWAARSLRPNQLAEDHEDLRRPGCAWP